VPPGSPDAADTARSRPPSDRLRVYSEERCHLTRCEKALIVAIHGSPPPISVSEHVFSVAKTSVYFLVFPKNEPLVSLVSFGFCRAGRFAGPAAQACSPVSPAVHGKWRDVPASTARVAQCAVHDYRMWKALLGSAGDYREFADSGACSTDLVCAIPVSSVADGAGALWNCESAPLPRWLRVGGMSDSRRPRRCSSHGPCRGDR
jgi:hypothetical protein